MAQLGMFFLKTQPRLVFAETKDSDRQVEPRAPIREYWDPANAGGANKHGTSSMSSTTLVPAQIKPLSRLGRLSAFSFFV